jgi:hypothetical protein
MPSVKKEKQKYVPKGKTIAELAKEVKPLIARKAALEAEAKELKSAIHAILVFALPPLMEREETDSKNIEGVALVELGTEVYPYVKKEDEPKFFEWVAGRGDDAIIKYNIHPTTLQSYVREGLENGVAFPDYLTVGLVPTAKIKAAKKSKRPSSK